MIEQLVRQILPKNATPLERAIVETLYERIDNIPLMISSIWDPWNCQETLLPWLAWATSVDVWNDEWSVAEKRAAIAASPTVHRKKGVPAALEEALKPFGLQVEIEEWWQKIPEGKRGSFDVTLWVSDRVGLDYSKLLEMREIILKTKPKSRSFELRIGVQIDAPAYAGVFQHTAIRAEAAADIPPAPVLRAQSGYAAVAHTHLRVEIGG